MNFVGYVDEITRFHVAGWVADKDDWQRSLRVDILINGEGHGFCFADQFREQLDSLDAQATGRYAFKFYFADPLSMFDEHTVSVRVSNTEYYLQGSHNAICAIKGGNSLSSDRPANAIIVTTMGRTGSTAVMALLAQHPSIVVAGEKPYEVELGCYYSYALRTLTAAGDHDRSLKPSMITASENRFQIGFNPYFEASFVSAFKDRQRFMRFMASSVPNRLGMTFREIVLDYYEELAKDKGIYAPLFFAEKSLPERDSRLGIRFMFPHVKEILLIRDLRDVLCSAMHSNKGAFETLLADTANSGRQLVDIKMKPGGSIFILKYEDFVLHRKTTADALFRYLGLTPIDMSLSARDSLFSLHGTSKSPESSIGRWQNDLTPVQQEKAKILNRYMEQLGYPV